MAYERAVIAADAAVTRERTQQGAEHPLTSLLGRGKVVGDSRAARVGPRPVIYPGAPIVKYTDRELAALIRWIESDTLLRTEAELYEQFLIELGFQRRGARIQAAFERALRFSRGR